MTATLLCSPEPIGSGQRMNVSGKAFDLHAKVQLVLIDDACTESGTSLPGNLPKRDGSFSVGLNAPKARGKYRLQAKQRGAVVAEFAGTVA
jgi:hypothetical protein